MAVPVLRLPPILSTAPPNHPLPAGLSLFPSLFFSSKGCLKKLENCLLASSMAQQHRQTHAHAGRTPGLGKKARTRTYLRCALIPKGVGIILCTGSLEKALNVGGFFNSLNSLSTRAHPSNPLERSDEKSLFSKKILLLKLLADIDVLSKLFGYLQKKGGRSFSYAKLALVPKNKTWSLFKSFNMCRFWVSYFDSLD